jgi:hypothetical protein
MEKLNLNPDPRLQPAPERDAFDYSVAAARVGGLALPFLGAGATFFDLVTAPLRGKRLSGWLDELRLRLNDLSQKVEALTPESLAMDEAFISAFAQATQAALRTHQKEKLDALRNAVLNVALGKETDANRQGLFLALVDRFQAAHLTVLRFFQDPAGHFERRGIPVPATPIGTNFLASEMVFTAMTELRDGLKSPTEDHGAASRQMIELLLNDLVSTKLLNLTRQNDTWIIPRFTAQPIPYPVNPAVTHLGDDFLTFITEPKG